MEKKNRLKRLNTRISRQSQTVNIPLEISSLKIQILSFRSKSSQLSSFKENNSSIAIGWEGENDRTFLNQKKSDTVFLASRIKHILKPHKGIDSTY